MGVEGSSFYRALGYLSSQHNCAGVRQPSISPGDDDDSSADLMDSLENLKKNTNSTQSLSENRRQEYIPIHFMELV